ncbi:MAG: hypothetical protein ABR499_06410 [Gemmatimonadaceae bacterium]
MIGVERGRTGGEQLLVLWTWLLEGYVPVAHTVADLDELDTLASNDSGNAPRGRTPHAALQLVGKHAA